MLTVDVTDGEWKAFVELCKKHMTPRLFGRRWIAVFTVTSRGDDFYFANWGNTPHNRRFRLKGIRFLEPIKREYRSLTRTCGRVFVSAKGVFYNKGTSKDKPVRFAAFRFPTEVTGLATEPVELGNLDDGFPAR
jgi:hypothetical protein